MITKKFVFFYFFDAFWLLKIEKKLTLEKKQLKNKMQDSFILVESESILEEEEEFKLNELNQNLIESILNYFKEEEFKFNFELIDEINNNRNLRNDNKLFIDELLSLIPIECK